MTLRFEWDLKKAETNLRKHGVSFEAAVRVFSDASVLITHNGYSDGEERWAAIGRIGNSATLFVVHTIIDNDEDVEIIRIVSARAATRSERREYDSRFH